MDGGPALDKRVGVGCGQDLVDEGDEEEDDYQVQLEVLEAVMAVMEWERVVGFGAVRLR